jgi:hypothetical protein
MYVDSQRDGLWNSRSISLSFEQKNACQTQGIWSTGVLFKYLDNANTELWGRM